MINAYCLSERYDFITTYTTYSISNRVDVRSCSKQVANSRNLKPFLNKVFCVVFCQRARDGETYELHAMLKSLPDQQRRRILNSSTDEEGVTALHLAARHNHYEVCKLLIDYGSSKSFQIIKLPILSRF